MWCDAMKGKKDERTGCGMLSVCAEWIWLWKGRDGWGVLFMGGKDRGLCKGARDGRE